MTSEQRCAMIGKTFRFEAAHQLPNHNGKCARPHGHSYQLTVYVRGPIKSADGSSEEGMVMDFGDLGTIVREAVIDRLDHRDLNQILVLPTTAENIAHWCWTQLYPHLGMRLRQVEIKETADSVVIVSAGDVS